MLTLFNGLDRLQIYVIISAKEITKSVFMRFMKKQIIKACEKTIVEHRTIISEKLTQAAAEVKMKDWRGRQLTPTQFYSKQASAMDFLETTPFIKGLEEKVKQALRLKRLVDLSPFDTVDLSLEELKPIEHNITMHHGA